MDGGDAGAVILQVLIQNVIDLSKNEITLIKGLDKEAAKLAGNLDTIQKFLNDAEMCTSPDDAVKSWLKKLEDASFDADNVLDELNYHHLSKKIKALKPMKERMLSCFSAFNDGIGRPRKMAQTIKDINEQLETITANASKLGLVERFAKVPTLLDATREQTDSYTLDKIFVGRDDLVSRISNDLHHININTSVDAPVISFIPIVGMGGLGKTTLTREVFKRQKERNQFGSHIWVHVSQKFELIDLLKKILKELTNMQSGNDQDSQQDILRNLTEALKDKTYLLVLDDVWNQDYRKWESFLDSLLRVTCTKRNVVIVTTRNIAVASIVNPDEILELEGLSDADCWLILKAKTFGNGTVPSDFASIGEKIGRKCKGSPLAANIVGGILRNASEEKWRSVEEEWLSHDEGDHITKVLKLSFNNLSQPSLKKCFAYCSIFRKGSSIWKEKLIELWMADGFLGNSGSNDLTSLGEKFINILLQNSLLQVLTTDDYGNAETYEMHDLVHDLACSVLGSSNSRDGSSRVRYMIHEYESSSIPKEVAKYLRTLLFNSDVSVGTVFSDFKCLRALDYSMSFGMAELPSSIRKLIHLRHLDVSGTHIQYLPDWIGELFQLLTLRTPYLRKQPSTIKYLINLRNLHINSFDGMPPGIGRLTYLETLSMFRVGYKNGCKIEELGGLDNLKGELFILNLERVRDKEEAEKAKLLNKSKILELRLKWNGRYRLGVVNDENVLEGLQPHPNLKKLAIDSYKGERFPPWMMKMEVLQPQPQGTLVGLNRLISVSLVDCYECEEIPTLGHLPNLLSLTLRKLRTVKCISASIYGLVNKETRVAFPALERLELIDMPELVKWEEAESASASEMTLFPNLHHLEITACKKLTSAPTQLSSCLSYMVIDGVAGYAPLENIFSTETTFLNVFSIQELDDVERLPDQLFYNNQNLSYLSIKKCRSLKYLPDGLLTLNSFKDLIIEECPNLARIADDPMGGEQSRKPSLRYLVIRECRALVHFPRQLLGPSLESLTLESLTSLENLPSLIDCLSNSSLLTNLKIVGVPTLTTTCSTVGKWPTINLHGLALDASIGDVGSMETVEGILGGCSHSLFRLYVKGMESWECLPESIQYLSALSELTLENFEVEHLPEWFGKLSSLDSLSLCNLKRLRHLPSIDAMHRLSLRSINIDGCPGLRIQSDEEGDSEWPKIYHIPTIFVDGSKYNRGVPSRGNKKNLRLGCI